MTKDWTARNPQISPGDLGNIIDNHTSSLIGSTKNIKVHMFRRHKIPSLRPRISETLLTITHRLSLVQLKI